MTAVSQQPVKARFYISIIYMAGDSPNAGRYLFFERRGFAFAFGNAIKNSFPGYRAFAFFTKTDTELFFER